MNKKTIAKRKLHEECWNLDISFIKWLHIRLPIYLHDADKIVNLDYTERIFIYEEQQYTLKGMIILLNSYINWFLNNDNAQNEELENKIFDIWHIIGQFLWW